MELDNDYVKKKEYMFKGVETNKWKYLALLPERKNTEQSGDKVM